MISELASLGDQHPAGPASAAWGFVRYRRPASNLFAQEIWYEVVAHLPLSKSRAPRLATMVRDIGFGWVWYGLILHYGINDMTIVAALIQI